MHLRSVLKDTPLWQGLLDALDAGGVLAGSSAGAMVLTDPMVDPRGGAFTLGLGLLRRVAVVPHVEQWSHDLLHRTLQLAQGFSLVTLESGAAVVRNPDGKWRSFGASGVYVDGQPAALTDLPPA
jgi:cyanophycinase